MQSDNDLLVLENLWVTDFVSEIKRVESYPDFEKLAQVFQYGLQGFAAKNIKGKLMDAGDLSRIL